MRTIRLLLEYDGTSYAGWQVQPDQNTIQGRLEAALETITGEPIRVVGSGRTDAGVHAIGQVGHFTTHSAMASNEFLRALNAILPRDIAVREVAEAPEGFHARYQATRKCYRYVLLQGESRSAFGHRYGWEVGYLLDVTAMGQAAKSLVGTHDFSAFRASGGAPTDPVRTLHRLDIEEQDGDIIVLAEADGFLRHMVRNLVGTLVEVGSGRLRTDEVKAILEARDRSRAGPTAPPQGLFLIEVTY